MIAIGIIIVVIGIVITILSALREFNSEGGSAGLGFAGGFIL